MKNNILFLATIVLLGTDISSAQNVGTSQWDIHLPYGRGNSVCETQEDIFVGTSAGMFSVNKKDMRLKRYSTVNGLSDVTVSAVGYSRDAECLVIGYTSGNIDLMKNGVIYNVKDILNAASVMNKGINSITIAGKFAYLACGFGIAVVDLEKEEIPSYVIFTGSNGFEMPVLQVALSDNGTISAAAEQGLFRYQGTGAFQDFGAWQRYPNLFEGTYNAIVNHDGKLYANYSRKLSNGIENEDTIFVYNGTVWTPWDSLYGRTIRSLDAQNGKLTLTIAPVSGYIGAVQSINTDGSTHALLQDEFTNEMVTAFTDSEGIVWAAHSTAGVFRIYNYNNRDPYYPEGPFSAGSFRMKHNGKHLWIAAGAASMAGYQPLYRIDGVLRFSETQQKWQHFNLLTSTLMAGSSDYLDILTTSDPDEVYTASYGSGVFRINGNSVTARYDSASTAGGLVNGHQQNSVLATSLSFDSKGALWVASSFSSKPLSVMLPNGTWYSYTIPGIMTNDIVMGVTALRNGQVWISVSGKGIFAVKHDNYALSQVRQINGNNGTGSLPSMIVHSMVQDHDGEVWVGTENGFLIFYNADAVFSGNAFNGVIPVVVADDNNNEKLLDGVFVRDIFVDGGNRKWMATYGAGAYLISADGYKILEHFQKANSPLLSDNVWSVAINPVKGNVYFGTDLGIVSYRGDATEADNNFADEVYAFPNPVRPEYTGSVTIEGLAKNAEVKITDISGQLVYQTRANGGTATWHGNSFNGKRAQTGVYLVFAANADGSQKEVSRILFIN